MRRVVVCLLLAVALGCGGAAKDEVVPLDRVPAEVMKVAQKELPDVTFNKAIRMANGGYQLLGKDKTGALRDIELTADGKLLEKD